MATSHHLRRGLYAALAATITALTMLVGPAPAHADPGTPQTSDEALTQINKLRDQFEVVTEDYNTANVKLGQDRKKLAQAQQHLKQVNQQIATLHNEVRTIATTAYQNGHLSSFSAFVSSPSPQSFLDRLSTLSMIASKQTSVLASLKKAEISAKTTQQEAAKAAAAAKQTTAELNNKKASIEKRIGELKSLMARLSAQERAQLAAQNSATSASQNEAASSSSNTQASPPPSPTGSSKAAVAVAAAEAQLGKPYVWAAAGPDSFDCSGLMLYAWAQAGVSLPHSSSMQVLDTGTPVSESQLQPGDLVGYYNPIHHVAMYVGHGTVIQAPDFGEVVKYSPLNSMPYTAASRPD